MGNISPRNPEGKAKFLKTYYDSQDGHDRTDIAKRKTEGSSFDK